MGETIVVDSDEEETVIIGDRDKAILQVFVTFISSVCVAYAIAFNDLYVAFIGGFSLLMTYVALNYSTDEFITPMKQFANPIEEIMLALVLYLTYAWIINPLIAGSGILLEIGLLVLIGIAPIAVILIRGCRYSLESIGFRGEVTENAKQFHRIVVFGVAMGFIISILPKLDNISALLTSSGLSQILYYVLFTGIFIGLAEELVFRGIVQPRVSQYYRSKIAGLLITSSVFAALHFLSVSLLNSGQFDPVNALFYAFLTRLTLGIALGFLWIFSDNIVLPWSVHAINNSLYGMLLVISSF